MCPDRLSFLTKFDKFYQELINLAKEDKNVLLYSTARGCCYNFVS